MLGHQTLRPNVTSRCRRRDQWCRRDSDDFLDDNEDTNVRSWAPLSTTKNPWGTPGEVGKKYYGKGQQTLHLKRRNMAPYFLVRRTEIWKKIWRQIILFMEVSLLRLWACDVTCDFDANVFCTIRIVRTRNYVWYSLLHNYIEKRVKTMADADSNNSVPQNLITTNDGGIESQQPGQ